MHLCIKNFKPNHLIWCVLFIALILHGRYYIRRWVYHSKEDHHSTTRVAATTAPRTNRTFKTTRATPRIIGPQQTVLGVASWPDGKELRFHCDDCAYVTSAGRLLKSGLGEKIDSHSCVFRSNVAPTTNFEQDVGYRTTVRLISPLSLQYVEKTIREKKPFDANFANESIAIVSRTIKAKHKANLPMIKDGFPDVKLYTTTDKYEQRLLSVYRTDVKHGARFLGKTGPSNGFVAMHLMHDVCDSIHVYGMSYAGYCERNTNSNDEYHYYQKSVNECSKFNFTNSGHDYEAEKELFRTWKDERKKLHFHLPEW